ncbi:MULTISPECIES: hypothetical protein [Rhodococcus]|uniref:hypothetical protein n=1 Tax=Rhodococcus TaxID=1827 RepID=UPI00138680BB|nr:MULTISPECIES: hypothetical protein [Rhodococcus]MBP2214800.1 hypothetical protein [Rhodococcus ruber]WML60855.1 hypothetical protein QNA09_00405 [Rhodococcus sp. AH-ZY2]
MCIPQAVLGNEIGSRGGIAGVKTLRLLPILAIALIVSGCGNGDSSPPAATTSASTSAPVATTNAAVLSTTASSVPDSTSAEITSTDTETAVDEPVMVEEPYIVDCQLGLGPIVTYWSDGTVTGYSDYCQSIHDQVLADEVAANTPVCDGTTCRYPSGATRPDTNSSPRSPSPWVQGQLDWQACREAGNSDEYCRLTLN